MKISWGVKISILYGGFVILIVGMVTMAMRQQVDLVSKDYYEQELKFQDKIDIVKRTSALETPLTWKLKKEGLELTFPRLSQQNTISGSIYFFRPSDASMDKTLEIKADTNAIRMISTKGLKRGLYKIQIDWNANDSEYYNEGFIQIN